MQLYVYVQVKARRNLRNDSLTKFIKRKRNYGIWRLKQTKRRKSYFEAICQYIHFDLECCRNGYGDQLIRKRCTPFKHFSANLEKIWWKSTRTPIFSVLYHEGTFIMIQTIMKDPVCN